MKTILKTKKNFTTLLATSMVFSLFLLTISCNTGPPKNSRAAQAIEGEKVFNEYCADCHGSKTKKAVASIVDTLSVPPIDLTQINKRRKLNSFPVAEIARIIDGRNLVKSHNANQRPMPIWGDELSKGGYSEAEIKGKKGQLIAYLIDIQE